MAEPIYKRILLKLSGEAFLGQQSFGVDMSVVHSLARSIAAIANLGVQIGVVIGAGNYCRGRQLTQHGINQVSADQMGMLATLMNALVLRDALAQQHSQVKVMSALPVAGVVDGFDRQKADQLLQQQHILIFSGGTGNPFFTTDAAASLRAIEIEADILLKATQVEGIYSADPNQDADATLYQYLSYQQVLEKELGVMDLAAFCQCRDYHLPIRVFCWNKNRENEKTCYNAT
jgi:uridylate kinase